MTCEHKYGTTRGICNDCGANVFIEKEGALKEKWDELKKFVEEQIQFHKSTSSGNDDIAAHRALFSCELILTKMKTLDGDVKVTCNRCGEELPVNDFVHSCTPTGKPVLDSLADQLKAQGFEVIDKLGDTDELRPGDYVEYTGASDEQVNWGNNDDPRGLLRIGGIYKVVQVEPHTWHTKLSLSILPTLKFNSVCFKKVHE